MQLKQSAGEEAELGRTKMSKQTISIVILGMTNRYCQFSKYVRRPVSEMKVGWDDAQPCHQFNKVSNLLTSRVDNVMRQLHCKPIFSAQTANIKTVHEQHVYELIGPAHTDQDLNLYIKPNITMFLHSV